MKTVFLGRAISKSKKRFDRLAIKTFFFRSIFINSPDESV